MSDIFDVSALQSNKTLYGAAIPEDADPSVISKIVRKRWLRLLNGGLIISAFTLLLVGLLIAVIYSTQKEWNAMAVGSSIGVSVAVLAIGVGSIYLYNQHTKRVWRNNIRRCGDPLGWKRCVKFIYDIP